MLEKLRKRLSEIAARLSALSGQAELTDAELSEIQTLTAEHASTVARIGALEATALALAAGSATNGRRTEAANTAPPAGGQQRQERTDVRVGQDGIQRDPMRGFRSGAEFALAVRSACMTGAGGSVDARLNFARAEALAQGEAGVERVGAVTYLNEGSAADSGWAVPPQMREGIWDIAYGGTDIVNMVGWEPTNSNTVEWEADESTPWATNGVTAQWRTEGGTMTATKPQPVVPRTLRVHELYAFVTATDELLEDAPRLESRLIQKAGRAINWKASEALMYGTGVGQPLGWMNSAAIISVAKESGQAAASIVLNNIVKMFSRAMLFGGRLQWFANQDILPALVPMTLGNYPLYIPTGRGGGVQDSLNMGTLLGIPLQWNPHCKTLGTVGDLQLVNLDGYYAIRRGEVKYATSMHLYFDTGKQAFRWTFRFGGSPYLSAPISPANGSNTQSHFVSVADRA